MKPFYLFASVCIFSHSHAIAGSFSHSNIVIRYIWFMNTNGDNKISCPFRHCSTYYTDVWHVKPMTTASACHFEVPLRIFLFFHYCVFISVVRFDMLGQSINSQKLFDLKTLLISSRRFGFYALASSARVCAGNSYRFSDNRFHDLVFLFFFLFFSVTECVCSLKKPPEYLFHINCHHRPNAKLEIHFETSKWTMTVIINISIQSHDNTLPQPPPPTRSMKGHLDDHFLLRFFHPSSFHWLFLFSFYFIICSAIQLVIKSIAIFFLSILWRPTVARLNIHSTDRIHLRQSFVRDLTMNLMKCHILMRNRLSFRHIVACLVDEIVDNSN